MVAKPPITDRKISGILTRMNFVHRASTAKGGGNPGCPGSSSLRLGTG